MYLFSSIVLCSFRYQQLPAVGSNARYTVLNVLGSTLSTRRYLVDSLDCGRENIDYYDERDLSIGGKLCSLLFLW